MCLYYLQCFCTSCSQTSVGSIQFSRRPQELLFSSENLIFSSSRRIARHAAFSLWSVVREKKLLLLLLLRGRSSFNGGRKNRERERQTDRQTDRQGGDFFPPRQNISHARTELEPPRKKESGQNACARELLLSWSWLAAYIA